MVFPTHSRHLWFIIFYCVCLLFFICSFVIISCCHIGSLPSMFCCSSLLLYQSHLFTVAPEDPLRGEICQVAGSPSSHTRPLLASVFLAGPPEESPAPVVVVPEQQGGPPVKRKRGRPPRNASVARSTTVTIIPQVTVVALQLGKTLTFV